MLYEFMLNDKYNNVEWLLCWCIFVNKEEERIRILDFNFVFLIFLKESLLYCLLVNKNV